MANDYKEHKRAEYLRVDTALQLLDDPNYSKMNLVETYSDLAKELKNWYQIAGEIKEEDNQNIKRLKIHYVSFVIREVRDKIYEWIRFFTNRQVIEIDNEKE